MAKFENAKNYKIIYKAGDKYGIYHAKLLSAFFAENGIALTIADDRAAKAEYEILLGDTSRYQTTLTEQQYAVRLDGKTLIFEGGHQVMVEKAIKTFIANGKAEGEVEFSGTDESFSSVISVDEKAGVTAAEGVAYKYVWGDEFDGNIIDTSKFYTKAHGFGQGAHAFIMLDGEKVKTYNEHDFLENSEYGFVRDGKITFHGVTDQNGIAHNARAFCTGDTMWWKYGYAEISAKVPIIPQAWPAWWTTANHDINFYPETTEDNGVTPLADWRYMPEIDMFEFWGDNGDPCANLHKWFIQGCFSDGTAGTNPNEFTLPTAEHAAEVKDEYKNTYNAPANVRSNDKGFVISSEWMHKGSRQEPKVQVDGDNFHKFGFLWTPAKMVMSVDGKVYGDFDLTNPALLDTLRVGNDKANEHIGMDIFRDVPAHMIFDNWLNTIGDFVGTKKLAEPGIRDYVIDYVRIYQVDSYELDGKTYKSGLWNYGLDRAAEK